MARYEAKIWQGQSGRWYCNDTSHIGAGSADWYIPARIMGISPAQFIEYLLKEFQPDYYYYDADKNFFSYSWASQSKANYFKLTINRIARDKNFQV